MVRATLPEVLSEDYVRTATAKGLAPRRITFLHTLPVALPPTLALIGTYIPIMLANVILVEAVFGIPGIYRLIPNAVDGRNFPVLMAIVIVAVGARRRRSTRSPTCCRPRSTRACGA